MTFVAHCTILLREFVTPSVKIKAIILLLSHIPIFALCNPKNRLKSTPPCSSKLYRLAPLPSLKLLNSRH